MTITKNAPDAGQGIEGSQNTYEGNQHMNATATIPQTTDISKTLQQLRESHDVSLSVIGALTGSSTNYIGKVEAGIITPTNAWVARYTYGITRAMKAPARPCPLVGCIGIHHDPEDLETNGWHTAWEVPGDECVVSVDMFSSDSGWTVYGRLDDDQTGLTADKVEQFYETWRRATAYARTLNTFAGVR